MTQIKRIRIHRGCFRFEVGNEQFIARFIPPPDGGLENWPYDIDHFMKWQLFKLTYHTHRFGKPLKVKRNKQRPRFKRVGGDFDSVKACEEEVRRIMEVDNYE